MEKWSSLLVQDTLTECLISELKSQLLGRADKSTFDSFSEAVESKSDVKKLRQKIMAYKKFLTTDLLEEIDEELAELKDDLKWKRSPRGKYVRALNDWLQPFHAQIRENPRFDGLVIGGHSKHEVIYVTGKVASDDDLNELLKLLHSHDPPWKIMVKLIPDASP